MLTPAWVADTGLSEFSDCFRYSGHASTQAELSMILWGVDPKAPGVLGGLYGVIDGLDHLQAMDLNCLFLTPIFSSVANHFYHTYDDLKLDHRVGGDDALVSLLEALHCRGMRLILDGVVNHCGCSFRVFDQLLENGEKSPSQLTCDDILALCKRFVLTICV